MRIIKLNRNKVYRIGIGTIFVFVILNRLDFIIGSKFTTGKVIQTKSWTRSHTGVRGASGGGSYSAPIIKFTDGNYDITFQGETNSYLAPGESVNIIYKKNDPTDAEVFSFIGFLLPSLLYSLIPILLLSAATYSFLGSTDTVIINLEKIYKINVSKELIDKQIDKKSIENSAKQL